MTFIQQVLTNPALMVTTLLTLGVIFVNGWTDAPNAIATCVTTRCMRVRSAVIMAAVFNFLGVFIMTQLNASVASTISNMVDFGGNTHEALIALCAALFSIVVYSVIASLFGIPTSESHSLIAGLSGAAIAIQSGIGGINMDEWVKVLYGLVASLVIGFAMGWVVCKLVTVICAGMERRRTNGFFKYAQIVGAASMSFMRRPSRPSRSSPPRWANGPRTSSRRGWAKRVDSSAKGGCSIPSRTGHEHLSSRHARFLDEGRPGHRSQRPDAHPGLLPDLPCRLGDLDWRYHLVRV